jgi:hypothetical protein
VNINLSLNFLHVLFNGLTLFLFLFFSYAAVPTKVKKTDLPVIPPESEILPSFDDNEDNISDDLNDDDDIEDQDEMVADEPLETLEEEEEDDDYDSDEDSPALDSDIFKDGECTQT